MRRPVAVGRGHCLAAALALVLAAVCPEPVGASGELQESVRLHRVDSALPAPDGLLTVGLALRFGSRELIDGDFLRRVGERDLVFGLEYGLLPSLNLRAEVPWRQWDNGFGTIPETGSGLGDGSVDVVWALPGGGEHFGWALRGGTSLPVGAAGLSEGIASPRFGLGLTLRLWRDSLLPEMRLHLNASRRWNRNEDDGYGFGATGAELWYPRYPAVTESGADGDNDFFQFGAALEFRSGTASLSLEYTEERLDDAPGVATREYQRYATATTRWGVRQGLALVVTWDVSLSLEDYETPFTVASPDQVYGFALAWQTPLGGRDRDGDGIPDRDDECPLLPEDRDGFRDDDGCPDPDNDEDGVLDVVDLAPLEAEDHDGFEDEDGRPDYDNDGDGIVDRLDACPMEAEDFDGHHDDDGCPEEFLDRDGDGIEDAVDLCPEAPEDIDGFEDEDGCPDPDNDLDGIADEFDGCPDLAEDYDGDADDDGCPDPMPEITPEVAPETGSEEPTQSAGSSPE